MEWIHDSICVLESNRNKEIRWKSDKEIVLAHKELDVVEVWDVMGSTVGEMPAKRSRTSSVEHMTTTAHERERCGTSNKEELTTTFEQDERRLKTALSKDITASSASSIDSRNVVRKLHARSITENVTNNMLENHGVKDQSLPLQKNRKENMFAGHAAEKAGQVETDSFGLNDVVKNVEGIDGKKNEESSGLKEVVENVEVTDDKENEDSFGHNAVVVNVEVIDEGKVEKSCNEEMNSTCALEGTNAEQITKEFRTEGRQMVGDDEEDEEECVYAEVSAPRNGSCTEKRTSSLKELKWVKITGSKMNRFEQKRAHAEWYYHNYFVPRKKLMLQLGYLDIECLAAEEVGTTIENGVLEGKQQTEEECVYAEVSAPRNGSCTEQRTSSLKELKWVKITGSKMNRFEQKRAHAEWYYHNYFVPRKKLMLKLGYLDIGCLAAEEVGTTIENGVLEGKQQTEEECCVCCSEVLNPAKPFIYVDGKTKEGNPCPHKYCECCAYGWFLRVPLVDDYLKVDIFAYVRRFCVICKVHGTVRIASSSVIPAEGNKRFDSYCLEKELLVGTEHTVFGVHQSQNPPYEPFCNYITNETLATAIAKVYSDNGKTSYGSDEQQNYDRYCEAVEDVFQCRKCSKYKCGIEKSVVDPCKGTCGYELCMHCAADLIVEKYHSRKGSSDIKYQKGIVHCLFCKGKEGRAVHALTDMFLTKYEDEVTA
jgi:hypothetical protein